MPEAIYTPTNCTPAYQLDWSYSVFWHNPPTDDSWLGPLRAAAEADSVRVLQHEFEPPKVSKFLISTQPHVSPRVMVQRLKGRLQHIIQKELPHAFRRNYGLRSIGSTRREKLDRYLASQLEHHPLADRRVDERMKQYQIHLPENDLAKPCYSSHSMYWYNLHIVIVNDGRYREARPEVLEQLRGMILKASRAKQHWLSRGAIVPDHIHLTLGCRLEESPEEVTLGYMNNLAYAYGMKPTFTFSYFVGTFSEYDLGVIPRAES